MANFESLDADWLSYDDALTFVLKQARSAAPLPVREVPLAQTLGRSLAEPVLARATLPAWANSAMDGFAVRRAEVEKRMNAGSANALLRLPVAGQAYPGSTPLRGVADDVAVRIMTGGPLPEGFDSVIRVEHTDGEAIPDWVTIHCTDDLGKHVRRPGQDMKKGDEIAPPGTVVHSGSLAVLLASGLAVAKVFRRPRVGVLSSGDELVDISDFSRVECGEGIPDSNRQMIAAAVAELGGLPVDLGVAGDSPEALDRCLAVAGQSDKIDLLVTTGGASMGERDLIKRVLLKRGLILGFWRACIRPGSPVSFGYLPQPTGDLPTFGLPGNPASAFVTFHTLVGPYLRARIRSSRPTGAIVLAHSADELLSPEKMTQFYRVRFTLLAATSASARPQVGCALTGPQGSGLVSSLRDADGLAVVPEGVSRIGTGEPVQVIVLPRTRA